MAFAAENVAPLRYLVRTSSVGTDDALLKGLVEVLTGGAKSLMILACSANQHSPHKLNQFLRDCPVPVFGGIFPEVFFSSSRLNSGFLIIGFPFAVSVSCYQGISDKQSHAARSCTVDGEIAACARDFLVFFDASSGAAEDFIASLYEDIGGGVDIIGGGCGSLDFQPHPCIFCRSGLLEDAALVVRLPVSMHCAADHGWQGLSGPYLVTEAEGVRVKTINYLPAADFYKQIIEDITDYRFSTSEFFEVSKNFPLGIVGLNKDILVRDPIQCLDSELVCVGRIPIHSMIYILCAQPENIIQAAERTGKKISNFSTNRSVSPGLTLAFDCVSRALYLGSDFERELDSVQYGLGSRDPLVGVLSIGEIANTPQGTICLLNKSIVLGHL
jgi:hypothetical protein